MSFVIQWHNTVHEHSHLCQLRTFAAERWRWWIDGRHAFIFDECCNYFYRGPMFNAVSRLYFLHQTWMFPLWRLPSCLISFCHIPCDICNIHTYTYCTYHTGSCSTDTSGKHLCLCVLVCVDCKVNYTQWSACVFVPINGISQLYWSHQGKLNYKT